MRPVLASCVAWALAGCAANNTILVDSVRQYMRPAAADQTALNPNFSYLRLTSGKNVALLVLGYVDASPLPETDVWYSGDKETIRLWHGRLAGTGGLATDWRKVSFGDVPSWKTALAGGATYRRLRDVMPGYAVGIRDEVRIVPIPAPVATGLRELPAQSLSWFEERTAPEGQAPALPPAIFAVDLSGTQERVVYSEQCLSMNLCLTLQAWPPRPNPRPSSSL